MQRQKGSLIALLCCVALLCGCTEKKGSITGSTVSLPPYSVSHTVPVGDTQQSLVQTVLLYLPSLDGTRLVAVPQQIKFDSWQPDMYTVCNILLSHSGNENATKLPGNVTLYAQGAQPVEITGSVATVNLSISAMQLTSQELYTVAQAITNTLCQFGVINYVNVLVAGVHPGLDIAATMPMGSLQANMQDDLNTLWERAIAQKNAAAGTGTRRFTIAASLYLPAPDGRGVLCEARMLPFNSTSAPQMIITLLEALGGGAQTLSGLPSGPVLSQYLLETPVIQDAASTGKRKAVLKFGESLNNALAEAGIARSVMMASIVYTLTTFMPQLDAVEVSIGGVPVDALAPQNTFDRAGETLTFANGAMQRSAFSHFLLTQCTLYFANAAGKLVPVQRAIPHYQAGNVRFILNQLMRGPQYYDTNNTLKAVLPVGLDDADLVGVGMEQDMLMLNFTGDLLATAEGMTPEQERLMVYGIVNTLASLPSVKRVAFFVLGEQPESLAGTVYLPGYFLPDWTMVQQ